MISRISAVALGIAMLSTQVMAQDGFYVGGLVGGGSTSYEISKSTNPAVTSSDHGHSALNASLVGGYTWDMKPVRLGLEAEFGYLGSESKQTDNAGLSQKVETDLTTALVGKVGLPVDDRFTINAIAGVRATKTKLTINDSGNSTNGSADEWMFGPEVGVGAEYAFNPHAALVIDARHTFYTSDISLRTSGGTPWNAKLENMSSDVIRAGVVYKF